MKPVMILDMSTLQSLSHGESQRLQHHFFLNVPQVMLFETLADLEQQNSDSTRGQTQVKAWATRMLQPGILFNIWHRDICLAELMGAEVEMCGAAIPQPPRKARGSDGEVLTIYDVTWQNQSLMRWLEGKFADDERSIAKEWRET